MSEAAGLRLLGGALALALAPLVCLHPVRIHGRSMEPGLRSGAVRLALRSWCAGPPAPGQVWLVRTQAGVAVKRLAGLPGDRVEFRGGGLFINGRRLADDGPAPRHPLAAGLPPAETRPAETGYFLLGDNLDDSLDSRAWGAVPRGGLLARILP